MANLKDLIVNGSARILGNIYGNASIITDGKFYQQEGAYACIDTSDLSEINPMITSYVNGTSGYNIWSNGYCEQWGVIPASTTSVSLLKTFTNTNYHVLMAGANYAAGDQPIGSSSRTISTFIVNSSSYTRFWKAYGYLADDQY